MNISDLDISKVAIEKTLQKEWADAVADGKDLVTGSFMYGKRPLKLRITGVLTSMGITVKKSSWGNRHSIGVEVDDKTTELFDELTTLLALETVTEEWEISEVLYKGKWYPKLKIDANNKNKYAFPITPKMTPNKQNEELGKGDDFEVETQIGAWFNLKEKKAGIFFTFQKVTFVIQE